MSTMRRPPSRTASKDSTVVDVDDLIDAQEGFEDDDELPPPLQKMPQLEPLPEPHSAKFTIPVSVQPTNGVSAKSHKEEDDVPIVIDAEIDVSGLDVDIVLDNDDEEANGGLGSGDLVEKAPSDADQIALLTSTSTTAEEPPKDPVSPRESQSGPPKDHERRRLLFAPNVLGGEDDDDDDDEDYGDDDHGDGYSRRSTGMDESHYRLKQRLSMMERMQSKFFSQDESKEKLLPQDTFSFIIIAETCSFPFWASLTIFVLQVTTFLLVLLDLAAQGSPGNIFGVPANASAQLRATQFIAVLVAVLTQGDLRVAMTLLRDGFTKELHAAFVFTTEWKFRLAILTRAVSGSIGLMVVYVLITSSDSVVGLLLDFTAVEFVSSIDELCFFLSKQGFLGVGCKKYGAIVATQMYKVAPESRQGILRKSWKTVSLLCILGVFFAGWLYVVVNQLIGRYMCNTIMVNMGDDFVPSLGAFNGLYDLEFPHGWVPFKERRATYVERRSREISLPGRGIFGYCFSLKAWTFRWESTEGKNGEETDFCDWVARSSETGTFDITETLGEPWFVRDITQRVVELDPFRLYCFDCENEGMPKSEDCGMEGTCSNGVCQCEDGRYGLRCEFLSPCPQLAIDERTDYFASTRDWSPEYQTIELDDGSLVEAYHRPVYVHEYENGAYDVVMFTGRRWALTSSEFLPDNGRVPAESPGEGTGSDIGNFFRYKYHGYQGYFPEYSVAFLSDFMDTTTHVDASSPVGFHWYRAVDPARTHDYANQGTAQEVESQFLCSFCDEDTNPCLYDGTCNAGVCECSTDSFGKLCEIPPVKNGHCDPYFNTPQFKMDGGDCCESTCLSSEQYICGAEEQGYVSTGYFHCKLPPDEWQSKRLKGDAGSYSGFALDLSIRSMAVAELLQDRVRIYDKVGSSWIVRDTLMGDPNTRFGTDVALSSGKYNVVSNPSFKAPLTVAIQDGFRTLRVYKCNLDGCAQIQEFPLVFTFAISDDGTVLATSLLFAANQPPNVIRIYEESQEGQFEFRTDVNVTRNNVMANLLSMEFNADGDRLAVQSQLTAFDETINFPVVTEQYVHVMVWNRESGFYEVEQDFKFESVVNTVHFPLSLGMSDDGTVLAYGYPECQGTQLHVHTQSNEGGWLALPVPPIPMNQTGCVDSERKKKNNALALSGDGSRIAFRLGTNVSYYKWESLQWQKVGDPFPLTHYHIAMSSDGTELAIGSPENDIGGVTGVYSLPGRKLCPDGMSLMRLSLTIDRLPGDVSWNLMNNSTGEVLFEQGPYPFSYAYATIVEETCVPTDSCYIFSIYNKKNRGLQAPGQYAIFMNGKDVARGTFSGLFQREQFGNCNTCPEGMKQLSMMMITCGPLHWALLKLIDQGANSTILHEGTTVGQVSGEFMYDTCFQHKVGDHCSDTVQITYDACLDASECYGVRVISQNLYTAYLEVSFGEQRERPAENAVCSGETTMVGQQDKCLQEDDWFNRRRNLQTSALWANAAN